MGWLDVSVLVYALIMLGGGIGGYKVAHSPWSLVTGIASAVLLVGAIALARTNPKAGYLMATLVTLALLILFIIRYVQTQKMMPSMGLVGLSLVMLLLLIVGHYMSGNGAQPSPPSETPQAQ